MAPTPIDWLSSQEAADYMGITARTIYKFINEGTLPGYRFGRLIKVKADDVEAFVESQRIEPGSLDHAYPEASTDRS